MRIIEILLRLGCGLVAWMVIYAHFIWTAVLRTVGCGPDGDELYRLLLGMVPFTVVFAFLLRSTRPLTEIHRILRWLGVPLLLPIALSIASIWTVLVRVNVGGAGLCTPELAATWNLWWAPVQILTLAVCLWAILQVWWSASAGQES